MLGNKSDVYCNLPGTMFSIGMTLFPQGYIRNVAIHPTMQNAEQADMTFFRVYINSACSILGRCSLCFSIIITSPKCMFATRYVLYNITTVMYLL